MIPNTKKIKHVVYIATHSIVGRSDGDDTNMRCRRHWTLTKFRTFCTDKCVHMFYTVARPCIPCVFDRSLCAVNKHSEVLEKFVSLYSAHMWLQAHAQQMSGLESQMKVFFYFLFFSHSNRAEKIFCLIFPTASVVLRITDTQFLHMLDNKILICKR